MRIRPLYLFLTIWLAASAQPPEKNPATTTVTGHVYCADTNTPARLASVMLKPVPLIERAGDSNVKSERHAEVFVTAVQTTLDGSFAIPKVSAGAYYVIAYKPGYLSSLATFPSDVLNHPSEDDCKRIATTVPKITVEAGLPASIEVRVERGAAISGSVLFDDGSPAADLVVHALVRHKQNQKDTWSPLQTTPFAMSADMRTDDLGHYRIVGPAPREYIIQVDLELRDQDFGMTDRGLVTAMMHRPSVKISFFSGDITRKRDARSFKLGADEERTGEDITIPLSKLHTITGELLAAHDGHVLTGGDIQVLDGDDKSVVEGSKVGLADSKFHLFFIPEGSYILHIVNAADVTYEDVPYPAYTMPPTHEDVHTLHTYGTLDQPLSVHDNIPNLTVSVPDKSTQQPNAQTTISQ